MRSVEEAEAALAGGADVIDVKEPLRGPLGRADREVISAIIGAVAGRRPLTAAAGELVETSPQDFRTWMAGNPAQLVKLGFANAASGSWRARLDDLLDCLDRQERMVLTAYADWQAAAALEPRQIAAAARSAGLKWLLVDTFNKSSNGLRQVWSDQQIAAFADTCSGQGLRLALAGQLEVSDLAARGFDRVDLIGFRGAACNGGRRGTVSADRVRDLVEERNRVAKNPVVLPAEKI